MSIVQYLQQTLLRDAPYALLEQIQAQHESTHALLEQIACMRQSNRNEILQSKIARVKTYLEIKEQINRRSAGLQHDRFEAWVQSIRQSGGAVVAELARQEQARVETVLLGVLREVFGSGSEDEIEKQAARKYLTMLGRVIELQREGKKPSRQQVGEISHLDQLFARCHSTLSQKVNTFNKKIEAYISRMLEYDAKIRSQFRDLLSLQAQPRTDQYTPLKNLQNQFYQEQPRPRSHLQTRTSTNFHMQPRVAETFHQTRHKWQYNTKQTFHPASFDTM